MTESKPSCFGIPEICMPRDDDGIIQPQEDCSRCEHVRHCLQAAIAASGGIEKIRPEREDATDDKSEEPSGIIGAIVRWSERKRAAQKD